MTLKKLTFAVVGATGNVGRAVLSILSDKGVVKDQVLAIASKKSLNQKISFGEDTLEVHSLEQVSFSNSTISFFCAGSEISRTYAFKAISQGSIVIDKSSLFRLDPDVPLIVPEVNTHAIGGYIKKGLIANPNCTTIPLMVVLGALCKISSINRVIVSTYQSVSGAGKRGMDELYHQTRSTYMNQEMKPQEFLKPIAFNVIPQIDAFENNGYTKEELKMMYETRKILDPDIQLTATCVRVPVFIGHSMSVNIEFNNMVTPGEARTILKKTQGVSVVDKIENNEYITPIEVAGEDDIFVSRIRSDLSFKRGLSLWISCDNLRKGAALNAVQIAEKLANHLKG